MSRIPLKQLKQSGAVDFNVARYNSTTGQWEPAVELAAAPTIQDKSLIPSATSGDNSTTGLTISSTPQGERYVTVSVNGISYEVGDGYKTYDCYFSNDGGSTARDLFDVEAGDTLYWNGVIAGFDLSATDRVDLDYDVDAAGNPEVLAPHASSHSDGGSDEINVVNLGSGAATAGQAVIADGAGGLSFGTVAPSTHASTHEQGGGDELIAQNLGSGSAPDGYVMVADGLGGWNVEEQSGGTGVVITPIVAGLQDSDSTTPSGVGACVINPSELGYPSAGYFELFNIDDGYAVVHDEISTAELTPTLLTATLVIDGANYINDAVDNLLEGRIYLASGAGVSDRVICKYAAIRSKPTT